MKCRSCGVENQGSFRFCSNCGAGLPAAPVQTGQSSAGERATARVVFLMLRRGQERPDLEGLGDDLDRWVERAADFARLYRLDLDLVKIDGDWLVQQARLER